MLSKNSKNPAMAIVEAAENRRVKLRPLGGSLLAGLAGSLVTLDPSPWYDELVEVSGKEMNALGGHSTIMGDGLPVVQDILTRIVNVAKNEVNGRIKTILTEVDAAILDHAKQSVGRMPQINIIESHPMQTNGAFRTLIEPFVAHTYNLSDASARATLDTLREASATLAFKELILTGVSSIDSDIKFEGTAEEAAQSALSDIEHIFRTLAMGSDKAETAGPNSGYSVGPLVNAFLFLHNIETGRNPAGAALIGKSENTHLLVTKAMAAIGRLINLHFVSNERLATTGNIIASRAYYYTDKDYVSVHGATYRKWLEDVPGACPEALMGWAIDGAKASDEAMLKDPEEVKRYVEVMEGRTRHIRLVATATRERDTRAAVVSAITRLISDDPTASDQEKAAMGLRLAEAVRNTAILGVMETHDYALLLVGQTWQVSSDAIDYLRRVRIELAAKESPTEDDLDLAKFMAMCKLIAKWVSSQVEVLPTGTVRQ